ncbi:hypothetical protein ACFL6I_17370 [candidate division KSB1 bacterium]
MNKILSVLLLFAVLACGRDSSVTLEFRPAQMQPSAGLTEMHVRETGETFYLHDEAPITNADIDTAFVGFMNGEIMVDLRFTETGSEEFARLTETNVGKHIGIIVGGELLSVPRVNAPITEGRAIINGRFTYEEASRIAAFICRK